MGIKGITFNNKHSYDDIGITMTGKRVINYPNKRKIKITPPFSNETYDFSTLYGDQIYEERQLVYSFNMIDYNKLDYASVHHIATKTVNWLMNTNGKEKLFDPDIHGYYFLAEVEGNINLENFINSGVLSVTFTAYPFKISSLPEGHDIWDEINFDLDVFQDVKFEIERLPFVPVETGSMATLTAWASKFTGGKPIKRELVGRSYKVLDIKEASSSESKRAYKLEGLSEWVVEQDIVQAQGDGHEITLYNPGTPSVTPIITTTYPTSIVFSNTVYNAWEGSGTSEGILLKSGENKLKLYTFEPATIEFEFYKELI